MGGMTSFDAVFVAMAFFVPGYVYLVVRGHIVPGHRGKDIDKPIRLLSISTANFMLWAWAVYLVLGTEDLSLWIKPAIWTFAILVGPAIVGIATGLATKFDLLGKFYRKLKFHPVHPVPTSWDFAFSQSEPCYMIVTMTDGRKFGGYWGDKSFASDDPNERDVYIETVFRIPDGHGEWTETDRGVLIRAEHIRSIEFIREPQE